MGHWKHVLTLPPPPAGLTSLLLFLTLLAAPRAALGTPSPVPAETPPTVHAALSALDITFRPVVRFRPNAHGLHFSRYRAFCVMSVQQRVARMPRASATSYGQIIEVSITTRPKQRATSLCTDVMALPVHSRSPLPRLVHARPRCDDAIPLPQAGRIAVKAIGASTSWSDFGRSQGAPSCVL
jgi:hypothetical protein